MADMSRRFPMSISDPFQAGTVIWFGSLEFKATGNSYLMELLSPRINPDVPAPQPRRRRCSGQRARRACMERRSVVRPSLPAWVEASVPQTDATMGERHHFITKTNCNADSRWRISVVALPLRDTSFCHDLRVISQLQHEHI